MKGLPRLRLFILAGIAIIVALAIFVGVRMFYSATQAVSGAPAAAAAADAAVNALYWVAVPIVAIIAAMVVAIAMTIRRLLKETNADLLRRTADGADPSAAIDGTGVILSAEHTGITLGKVTALFHVRLRVVAPDCAPYEAETKVKLRRRLWGLLSSGMTVAVRIDSGDPQRIAVDWDKPA